MTTYYIALPPLRSYGAFVTWTGVIYPSSHCGNKTFTKYLQYSSPLNKKGKYNYLNILAKTNIDIPYNNIYIYIYYIVKNLTKTVKREQVRLHSALVIS